MRIWKYECGETPEVNNTFWTVLVSVACCCVLIWDTNHLWVEQVMYAANVPHPWVDVAVIRSQVTRSQCLFPSHFALLMILKHSITVLEIEGRISEKLWNGSFKCKWGSSQSHKQKKEKNINVLRSQKISIWDCKKGKRLWLFCWCTSHCWLQCVGSARKDGKAMKA